MWCQGSNLHQWSARQAPCPLHYLSGPHITFLSFALWHLFKYLCWGSLFDLCHLLPQGNELLINFVPHTVPSIDSLWLCVEGKSERNCTWLWGVEGLESKIYSPLYQSNTFLIVLEIVSYPRKGEADLRSLVLSMVEVSCFLLCMSLELLLA